jgi:hypothetical protein
MKYLRHNRSTAYKRLNRSSGSSNAQFKLLNCSHQLPQILAPRCAVSSRRTTYHDYTTLANLRWLRAPERIAFKLAVGPTCFHMSEQYGPSLPLHQFHRIADIPIRQRLRSSSTLQLDVPPARLATVGDRVFNVAAARLWNSLPPDITAAQTLFQFRRRLKTHFLNLSFPPSFSRL